LNPIFIDTESDIKKLLSSHNIEEFRIVIAFSEVEYFNDVRILEYSCIKICNYLSQFVEHQYFICYSQNIIILVKRGIEMKSKFTIEIPYGERSKYFRFIYEINQLVDNDGVVAVFVNNNPYQLQSLLVIQTHTKEDKIKELIFNSKLQVINNKGLDELLEEQYFRKWINFILSPQLGFESVCALIASRYYFAEKDTLKSKGYDFIDVLRKKVFISYCHSNKELVLDVVDKLEQSGVNLWIDKKNISVGEHILEAVLSGINESHLAIFFLSKDTLQSAFAKYEVKNIMQDVIYRAKNWYIIKIDDVNPNEILPGLGQFLYYDLLLNPNPDLLIKDILNKIKSIDL